MRVRHLTKHLTFDPSDLDLSKNEPLKGNFEVTLHPPTKFGGGRPKDAGGVGEQTDKQTDRQTDRQTLLKL